MPNETPIVLDPRVAQRLAETHAALTLQGELLDPELLPGYSVAFRERFGPDKLRTLDGEELLLAMHAHNNKDSLVYWLEFKNDSELPSGRMGSIMGGSAHKFNLFRRQGTNQWVAGSSQKAQSVSVEQAIEIAHRHRDQLLAAASLLQALQPEDGPPAYLQLQKAIEAQAPDLWTKGWTHKYLSLLFPEKLDDYHSVEWQEHQLLRLLIPRASGAEGLYVNAYPFVRLAAELGWPMNHLTRVLNSSSGPPVRYWRIGTVPGEGSQDFLEAVLRGPSVAFGGEKLGDLSPLLGLASKKLRAEVLSLFAQHYQIAPAIALLKGGEIAKFAAKISQGDIVLAANGHTVLGIGCVTGPYQFDPATPPMGAPHRRPVEWISTQPFSLPNDSFLFYAPPGEEQPSYADDSYEAATRQTTLTMVREMKHEANLLAIERARLDGGVSAAPAGSAVTSTPAVTLHPPAKVSLDGIPGRIQSILERKGQVILHGPPGTGKTYWARGAARDLAAVESFGRLFAELSVAEKATVDGTPTAPGLVRACTFHPAYGYEDFLEGYRPHQGASGQLLFERRAGIFLRICRDAEQAPGRNFILLVDEINRGDIPRIFGELLTLLESDKRGNFSVQLPLSGESFTVPPNVWIIGTMNTADRSIALLDVALRRRFGFIELMPDPRTLDAATIGGTLPLGAWLRALNALLRKHAGRDARNLQIGHAYLLDGTVPVTSVARLARILAEDLIPLLEEYCYEDYARLAKILGSGLVDESTQSIRRELFDSGREVDLLDALLAIQPGIATLVDPETVPVGLPGEEDDDELLGEDAAK
jgi:5-methylcytosine-specific restriction protein B